MVDELMDQSVFEGQQAVIQPPPTKEIVEADRLKNAKRKRLLIIAGTSLLGLMILGLVAAIYGNQEGQSPTELTPSPTPIKIISEKQQQLDQLKQKIDKAAPNSWLILPPEVDMRVVID